MENSEVITFGGCRALLKRRGDGLWVVRWREARRGRNTTATTEKRARELARKVVRRLAGVQGGHVVSGDEMELIKRLREICGPRAPFAWLSEMEELQRALAGRSTIPQAVRHFIETGMLQVERVSFRIAQNRFIDAYDSAPVQTRRSLGKLLRNFAKEHGEMFIDDIKAEALSAWLRRGRKGTVGPKTFNNRLGWFKTFLNCCRDWGYLPSKEKHAGEFIKKVKEPDVIPEILTVAQATKALGVLPARLLPTFIIGCWMGPRPMAEMRRLDWSDWDWERKYLHVSWSAAGKTMRERFVPIPTNVQKMLRRLTLWGRKSGAFTGRFHVNEISALLRQAKIIARWSPDIMRHSSISYRLARGDSRSAVAEMHGNSEAIIRKRYRRPLRREDGAAWFAIGEQISGAKEQADFTGAAGAAPSRKPKHKSKRT